MKKTKTSTKKDDFSSIAVFLIFECVALLCFCLGGIATIFHYIGFVIAVFSLIFSYKNFDKREIGSLILIGAPILILAIFCGFGKLNSQLFNNAAKIGIFLAIPGFFLLGLCARRMKSFNAGTALLCMGVGAGLLVLISLFSTWIQYGFFYTLLFKNTPNYYYNGYLYNVTTEMSWLNGLKFSEISIKYGGLFGACLCAAIPALFFISPKTQTRKFIIVAAIGLVGLLSIVTIVNVVALIFLIPIILITIIYKLLRDYKNVMKTIRIILVVIAGLVCLFLVFAVLNATIPAINSFTSNNRILNRLFNTNRFASPFNAVINAAFKSYNIFGFIFYGGETYQFDLVYTNTGNFVLEITKEGGLFALISILMVIVLVIISTIKYLKKSKDGIALKVTMLSLLVTFFLYSCFNWDIFPLTHQNNLYYMSPVTSSFPFMIMIFVIGLFYYPILMKDDPIFESLRLVKEEIKVKKVTKYVDEDYVFTSEEGEKNEK